jgi:hypothetical protein
VQEQLGSLLQVVLRIIDRFEAAKLDYALGGAIAYSAWAEPRATRDIDLNVWVDAEQLGHAFDTLGAAGVEIDRERAAADARERGMFVGYCHNYRVDVFVPSVPFYAEARHRRQRIKLADRDTWVLSPESLIVFKMLFFRPKDVADVGRILDIQGPHVDATFVRQWLVKMLGRSDARITTWDRLVAQAERRG